MTSTGRLWNGRVRTVAPFVNVEELPSSLKPIGTELNIKELELKDLKEEIFSLNFTIEEQLRRINYLEGQLHAKETTT
jgi:hypothetical protein